MELVGEEKRTQALFRELRLEDEHVTPRFADVWHRAQSGSFVPRRTFKFSFVAATALAACVLVSAAWLLRQWQRSQGLNSAVVSVVPLTGIGLAQTGVNSTTKSVALFDPVRADSKSRLMKLLIRRRAQALAAKRAEISNAAAISRWEAPTTALLRSPVDAVLTSVPQLNESVNELKSFLPSRSN